MHKLAKGVKIPTWYSVFLKLYLRRLLYLNNTKILNIKEPVAASQFKP
jgi:hypothetical protein